ncbi:MAG: hypothetical protein WC405_06030 [Syntrophales bacterium]
MIAKQEFAVSTLPLDALSRIISKRPKPQVDTEVAQFSAYAIANHLIFLVLTVSDANVAGRHSAAISLFHNVEDALDCFGAVTLVPGAAELWANGDLKASQATMLYEGRLGAAKLSTGEAVIDYRRRLRSHFQQYEHCTPNLIDWDLYPYFSSEDIKKLFDNDTDCDIRSEIKVNPGDRLLSQNANRIGDYLAAYTLEFSRLTEMGYKNFLEANSKLKNELEEMIDKMENKTIRQLKAVYLELLPPEMHNPRIQHPDNPAMSMDLNLTNPMGGEA